MHSEISVVSRRQPYLTRCLYPAKCAQIARPDNAAPDQMEMFEPSSTVGCVLTDTMSRNQTGAIHGAKQEIWANAHGTRDSTSLISYAGCLGLSPFLQYISAKIYSKCAPQPKIAKNLLKTHIFAVQGRSMSSMLAPPESSSAVVVTISSKSVSICNHSRARLVDSSRNRTFSKGYPNLMHSYGGLLEPRGSSLTLLKSTFNAEHFISRLSWSILIGFGAIHS